MKRIFIVFSLLVMGIYVQAQSALNFDKLYIDCIDKWVALPMDDDSTYMFGFVYLDEEAGLTLDRSGRFKVSTDGDLVLDNEFNISAGVKFRLPHSYFKVAIIPNDKLKDLNITDVPQWLFAYKTDTLSAGYLYAKGYLYNGWNRCEQALTYLESAYDTDPAYKGLATELAFSYNCLKQYPKALWALQEALKADPTDAYTNKELIYTQINLKMLGAAAKSCKKAIEVCKDQSYNAENCYNLTLAFYEEKDKKNFKYWLKQTRKWLPYAAQNGDILGQYADALELTFEK